MRKNVAIVRERTLDGSISYKRSKVGRILCLPKTPSGDFPFGRDDVVISGSLSDDEARRKYHGWKAPRPYLRIVPEPTETVREVQYDI